jgi:hypothetical protein
MTTFAAAANWVIHDAPYKGLVLFDRIKANPNALGKLFSMASNGMELAKLYSKTKTFDKTIRVFGGVGAVYDTLQIFGTLHYLGFNACTMGNGGKFFTKDNSPLDFLTEISFGIVNVGGAILWADQHKLIDLGRYTVQSIGGAAAGSAALLGAISMGLVAGFTVMTVDSLFKLEQGKLTANQRFSHQCSVIWTVTEIALIIIPAIGFVPAAPWMMGAAIAAKGFGLTSFIYTK